MDKISYNTGLDLQVQEHQIKGLYARESTIKKS